MIRRCPAASAEHVDESARGELAEEPRGFVGLLVVLAEGVRQARIRVAGDIALRDAREVGHVWTHIAGAEGAVDPYAERPGVTDRGVEGVERLPRERTPAAIRNRDGDHQRQPDTPCLEHVLDGNERGFRDKRIEDGLEQQDVSAAIDQATRLLLERLTHGIECGGAERRVVHVG